MAGPTIQIEAPPRSDRLGGIGDIATFRSNDRLGAAAEVVFQSDACSFPSTEENRCYAAAVVSDKSFTGIDVVDAIGAPFTLYAGVKCFAGPDPDELQRASEILDRGRDRELENALEVWAAGGTVLAAGGFVINAIANVEQALDDQYLGRGVILMSRADAVMAAADQALIADGSGRLFTPNGTPVIASGRVTPGVVYGLGAIVVEYTDTFTREVIQTELNQHFALAEAMFVLAVDCGFRVSSTSA